MFYDPMRPIIVVALYFVACFACYHILNAIYDWRTGTLKGWPAKAAAKPRPASPAAKPQPLAPAKVEKPPEAPASGEAPDEPIKEEPAEQPAQVSPTAAQEPPSETSETTSLPFASAASLAAQLPDFASDSPPPAAAVMATEQPATAGEAHGPSIAANANKDGLPADSVEWQTETENTNTEIAFAEAGSQSAATGDMKWQAETENTKVEMAFIETTSDSAPTSDSVWQAEPENTKTGIAFAGTDPHPASAGDLDLKAEAENQAPAMADAHATSTSEESQSAIRSAPDVEDSSETTPGVSTDVPVETSNDGMLLLNMEVEPDSQEAIEIETPESLPAVASASEAVVMGTTSDTDMSAGSVLVVDGGEKQGQEDARTEFAPVSPRKNAKLSSKEYFDSEAALTLERWQVFGESFCVLLFALDSEEATEDDHSLEDELAQAVTTQICEAAKQDALVAQQADRIIVLARNTKLDEAKRVAERMRRAVAESQFFSDGNTLQATVSCGLAGVSYQENIDQVSIRAHEALQVAIQQGGDRVYFHDGTRCRQVWRTANVEINAPSLVTAGVGSTPDGTSELLNRNSPDQPLTNAAEQQQARRRMSRRDDNDSSGTERAAKNDEKKKKGHKDKRKAPRTPLGRLHPIAPYAGTKLPKDSEYRLMECKDISSTGFSFFARHPPSWSQLIVKILGRSLVARIVHRTRTSHEDPEKRYLIGCFFTGSIDSADAEKK